jgi:hypothetical protein
MTVADVSTRSFAGSDQTSSVEKSSFVAAAMAPR